MDCNEIIKGSGLTNRRTIRGKRVRIKEPCINDENLEEQEMESDDEFEKEMNSVFEERLQQAELNGGIISSIHEKLQEKGNDVNNKPQTTASSSNTSYDPIYFDSDDDSDEESNFEFSKLSDNKSNRNKFYAITCNILKTFI